MTFNSWSFFLFFPTVTTLYFAIPNRWRWLLLLVASCAFYMAFIPAYILILLFTIAVDYVAGILIEQSSGQRRRVWLICSLIANIGMLAVFKYGNFANANLAIIARLLDLRYPAKVIQIILPIGLSFHTFQAMSYTIEVYRGHQRAERHLGIYALYVMFYPQLVAGPIERPQNLLHQFHEPHDFDGSRVADGLSRMLWGLFKKIVIADRLAIIVNTVYAKPGDFSGIVLLLATYCFAIQIYADFSAYSDIALGAARVMGITLMENFDRPYLSTTMSEFWKRWHISLSTWFRDYLYIPLGGNRVSTQRWCFNIMIVFLLSGLWHGANWTFIIWGALHGFYLLFGILTRPARDAIAKSLFQIRYSARHAESEPTREGSDSGRSIQAFGVPQTRREVDETVSKQLSAERFQVLRQIIAMLIVIQLTTFAWVFFRAENFSQAIFILHRIVIDVASGLIHIPTLLQTVANLYIGPIGNKFLQLTLWILIAAGIVHLLRKPGSITRNFDGRPAWLRWAASYAIIFCILLLGIFGSQSFIYFQF